MAAPRQPVPSEPSRPEVRTSAGARGAKRGADARGKTPERIEHGLARQIDLFTLFKPQRYWSSPPGEAPEVIRLFPTFVWKCQLRPEVYRPVNESLLKHLEEIRRDLPPLDRGATWQSGHGLHKLEQFRALVSCIGEAIDAVLAFLRIESRDVAITGCWANVNAPGAVHRMHAHPNNFLSGVYYAQVHNGADTINFHDPRTQVAIIRPPVTELTAYNTDQVVVKVGVGTLIVFPAWLPHSVDANRSERVRISISFNAMFAAFAETMGHPLWGAP